MFPFISLWATHLGRKKLVYLSIFHLFSQQLSAHAKFRQQKKKNMLILSCWWWWWLMVIIIMMIMQTKYSSRHNVVGANKVGRNYDGWWFVSWQLSFSLYQGGDYENDDNKDQWLKFLYFRFLYYCILNFGIKIKIWNILLLLRFQVQLKALTLKLETLKGLKIIGFHHHLDCHHNHHHQYLHFYEMLEIS